MDVHWLRLINASSNDKFMPYNFQRPGCLVSVGAIPDQDLTKRYEPDPSFLRGRTHFEEVTRFPNK